MTARIFVLAALTRQSFAKPLQESPSCLPKKGKRSADRRIFQCPRPISLLPLPLAGEGWEGGAIARHTNGCASRPRFGRARLSALRGGAWRGD